MGIENQREVYVLHHVHEFEANNEEDVKLLGIFSSEEKAMKMVKKYKKMPGFKDHPEGFSVDKYIINKAEWTEGFVTLD